MTNFDDYFLLKAKEISENSKETTKIGCVLVKDDKIISTGYNQSCIQPSISSTDLSDDYKTRMDMIIHAEMDALSKLNFTDKIDTVYVYPTICKSICCVECTKHLISRGIKRIVGYKPKESFDIRWIDQSNRAKTLIRYTTIEISFI